MAKKIKIPLVKDTIDKSDIDNLVEWLQTYPRVTKGPKTIEYENAWSEWLGCKYSVFVNSGSSANLLMLYTLKVLGNLRNDTIVVPALSWATDLAPVIQLGFRPELCDCNTENLSVDVEHLEKIFEEHKPAALLLVSVLGLSPDMGAIVSLCKKHGVILLEDNCESQGTEYGGVKLGNFGLMSSFSTYFGHTMSTIEGGMVCTNDEKCYNILKMLRSHGWDRDLDPAERDKLRNQWGVDDFSALYTFYVPGFNLRSTDLQAVIGLRQLSKVDGMIKKRNQNFNDIQNMLHDLTARLPFSMHMWHPKEVKGSFTASFCYPIIFKSEERKNEVVKKLQAGGVETRPLICGSMGTQPFYIEKYGRAEYPNADKVDKMGIYIPNNPELTREEIKYMCEIIIPSKSD